MRLRAAGIRLCAWWASVCVLAGGTAQAGTWIADNAGLDGAVVLEKVRDMKGDDGYDAQAEKYCDLIKAGIVDPTKVVRSALQNAASVAGLLLTTDCLVSEIPEKKEKAPAGGGGGPEY